MTETTDLFDTTGTPDAPAAAGQRALLPVAASSRFSPLRYGVINIWEYDDVQLWPVDGRLILRGQNTSGKSKFLELMLPFVLDGDIRPERLDPFGGQSKTMYWNLIEFDETRRSEIGYCWAEFGCVAADGPVYVTVIVGMRATRTAGRKVDTWFAVTRQRVGVNLDLAPGGVPLAPDRLRAALTPDATYTTTAGEHRAAVDKALFGLGKERYSALIHLLLTLRRPKLSEKLNLDKTSQILTEALPPLERSRFEMLAASFARLDASSDELATLEAAHNGLVAFLGAYTSYAQLHAKRRADRVRSANTQFDKVTEAQRLATGERDRAAASLAALAGEQVNLAETVNSTEGALRGLDMSKVHAINEIRDKAHILDNQAAADAKAAETAATGAETDRLETLAADTAATGALTQLAGAIHDSMVLAGPARLPHSAASLEACHDVVVSYTPGGDTDPSSWSSTLTAANAAAGRHTHGLRELRTAIHKATGARAAIDKAAGNVARAAEDADTATARRDEDAKALDDALAEFERCVDAHVDDLLSVVDGDHHSAGTVTLDTWLNDDPDLSPGQRLVGHLRTTTISDRAARAAFGRLIEPALTHLDKHIDAYALRIHALRTSQATATNERARLAAESDPIPPSTPGRPATRIGVPVWRCVDFVDGTDDVERARLEAALEAAGLLTAVITADGALVRRDTLDTIITATGRPVGTRSARVWLSPAANLPSGVERDQVGAVLDSIAACDTDADRANGVAVALDGSWRVGNLSGRWTKETADFIGAANREAARARRLAAIDTELARIGVELDDVVATKTSLDQLNRQLRALTEQLPDTSEWSRCIDRLQRSERVRTDSVNRHHGALEALAAAEQAGRELLATVERLVERCAVPVDDVDTVLDATADHAKALDAAVARLRELTGALDRQSRAQARARRSRAAADATAAAATESRAAAVAARSELEEIERQIGADAAAVLARKAQLDAALAAARTRAKVIETETTRVREIHIRADQKLSTITEDRRAREAERTDALASLAAFLRTELAQLAVPTVDRTADHTQVSIGLRTARAINTTLQNLESGQEAADRAGNALGRSFTALQQALGARFDPHLDTVDGLQVCFTTMNGVAEGAVVTEHRLRDQLERNRQMLAAEERKIVEEFLLGEVGAHLGERVHQAYRQVDQMNRQLREHPTSSGLWLSLKWEPVPDAAPGTAAAMRLLGQKVTLMTDTERATLSGFLADQVREARESAEGGNVAERLAAALDYRQWCTFRLYRHTPAQPAGQRLTARAQGTGSGGEQAKLAHLPLFAATAAYYTSAAATAPRLIMLDEAFAGIDDAQRADCYAALVEMDLDFVATNFSEWGCYPTIPGLATYHLERLPGVPGVAALRYVWDGTERFEDDPFA